MKYPLVYTAICAMSLLGAASGAQAQTEPTVTVHTTNTQPVYWLDFDVLALDFTLHAESAERLKALTLAKSGNAYEGLDYTKLTLWADRGAEGFQGWGYDERIADGVFDSGMWVFDKLDVPVTGGSQRFFVSLESAFAPLNRTLQLSVLPTAEDGDGVYEKGEQGVFLSNSVVKKAPDQYFSQTINFKTGKVDVSGPKAYVKDVSVNSAVPTIIQKAAGQSSIVIKGEARDRNGGYVLDVKVLVNGQPIQAEGVGSGFAEWQATYIPTMLYEPITVKVTAKDYGYEFTSESYYAVVDSRAVSTNLSTFVAQPDIVNVGQSSSIQVTLRAEDNSLISGRQVTFQSVRTSDTLSASMATTDANGSASVSLTPNAFGIAVVKVLVDGVEVGSVDVSAAEAGQETPGEPTNPLDAGQLVKGSTSAVYYMGSDGKRHVFENVLVYQSWYGTDFSRVVSISDQLLASRPLGEAVPYRPGSLIKVPSVPEVYVVDVGNVLRHVTTEAIAKQLFGEAWSKQVRDLQESLLFTYEFGSPIDAPSDYDANRALDPFLTIDDELSV